MSGSTMRGRVGRAALRAVLAVGPTALGMSVAADAAAFPPDCRFGVNAHQVSNSALDQAATAGIGWVRFDFNWFQFEPQKGNYDWTQPDRLVDHATSLGQNVFATIAYSPSWAVAQPCNDQDPEDLNKCRNRPPLNVNDWTDFVTACVNRYKDKVKHWGMWNEPNLLGFFNGTRDQYVSDLLIPGSNAVHAACPSCFVLGPELAHLRGANWDAEEGTCVAGECWFNGWNHSLPKVLEAAGSYIDIITHHKYKQPAGEFWTQAVDGEFLGPVQFINGIKELTDQYAPGKPVWITEFGMEAEPFGEHTNAATAIQLPLFYGGMDQIQAGTFAGAINQPWPELQALFWYDLVDDPNGYSWGLLNSDESSKPQYDAYAEIIQQLGPCTGGGSAGGGGAAGGTGGTGGSGTGGGAVGGGSVGGGSVGGSASGGTGAGGPGGTGSGAAAGHTGSDPDTDDDSCATVPGAATTPSAWLAVLCFAAVGVGRRRGRRSV